MKSFDIEIFPPNLQESASFAHRAYDTIRSHDAEAQKMLLRLTWIEDFIFNKQSSDRNFQGILSFISQISQLDEAAKQNPELMMSIVHGVIFMFEAGSYLAEEPELLEYYTYFKSLSKCSRETRRIVYGIYHDNLFTDPKVSIREITLHVFTRILRQATAAEFEQVIAKLTTVPSLTWLLDEKEMWAPLADRNSKLQPVSQAVPLAASVERPSEKATFLRGIASVYDAFRIDPKTGLGDFIRELCFTYKNEQPLEETIAKYEGMLKAAGFEIYPGEPHPIIQIRMDEQRIAFTFVTNEFKQLRPEPIVKEE